MPFLDRFSAAKLLAKKLLDYKNHPQAIILAIPRGGVQVGYTLAKELHLPLDIILTKKIGHPHNSEYAIGAVSLTGHLVDKKVLAGEPVGREYITSEVKKIQDTLRKRYRLYRGQQKPPSLRAKIVILTDDGIATGRTMSVAITLIKKEQPQRIIVAIPVGPQEAVERLRRQADQVICLETPLDFFALGQHYQQFEQVEDKEAIRLLKEANK